MFRHLAPALLGLTAFFCSDIRLPAQCGGNGPATFEFIATDNKPIGPGSKIILRLTGEPLSFFCLLCDLGKGPVDTNIGRFCLDLGPGLIEFVEQIPASGVLDIPITIPVSFNFKLGVCCQWFGINLSLKVALANQACLCLNYVCKGGVNEIRYLTRVKAPASFPADVTSSYASKDGKTTYGTATVKFDPANPPAWPVTGTGKLFIEKISVMDGALHVITRVSHGVDAKNAPLKFPSNDIHFGVVAGAEKAGQVIHVSCSQPIDTGLVFGPHTILNLTPVSKVLEDGDQCEGGVNKLCHVTTLNEPTSYPVKVTTRAGKKDASSFFYTAFVDYDKAKPPTFPITQDGKIFIDNIVVDGGKMTVTTRVDNGMTGTTRNKFPTNDVLFQVLAGTQTNGHVIHVSCSQPIGLNMVFGPFKITCFQDVGKR